MGYQSQAFGKVFKHLERFSSIFMQAHAKRDLYDTLLMIKETSRDVEGCRGISRINVESSQIHRELVGTSRDVAGSSRD